MFVSLRAANQLSREVNHDVHQRAILFPILNHGANSERGTKGKWRSFFDSFIVISYFPPKKKNDDKLIWSEPVFKAPLPPPPPSISPVPREQATF